MANVLPDHLMNSVLGKLYDVLCTGDQTAPASRDNFLAWLSPGIPYSAEELEFLHEGLGGVYKKAREIVTEQDEELVEELSNEQDIEEVDEETSIEEFNRMLADEARAKYIHAENLSRLCDLIPDTSGEAPLSSFNIWNSEMTLSNAYDMILRFSKVADTEPSEKTKQILNRLRGYLEDKKLVLNLITGNEEITAVPSPLVKKYGEYLSEWEIAKMSYNNARIEALAGTDERAIHNWAINGPILRRRVSAAMNNWTSLGYKNQFEQINAYISQIESRSISLLKQQYLNAFEEGQLNSVLTGLPFWPAMLIPGGFAKSEKGWTTFKFDSNDYEANYDYSKKKGTGKASLGFGLFRASAKGKYEKEELDENINTSRFSLRFKLAQTPIIRPALNFQFLSSRYWKFDENIPDIGSQMVSDGKNPARGLLPAYSTACIWIKDLELEFDESEYGYEQISTKSNGRVNIGWGPFSLGGTYSQDNFSREVRTSGNAQSIRVHGMQLIGFKCHILPKSPNPSASIEKWI